jgi:hypothetical protein
MRMTALGIKDAIFADALPRGMRKSDVADGDNGLVESRDINDPGLPANKHRTRESQRQLRELLMVWDLCLVAGAPEAADEYDCMLSPLMHLLHEGADEAKILYWLYDQVQDHFGVKPDPEREGLLAEQIMDWWRQRCSEPATS